MSDPVASPDLAARVRRALESGDLKAIEALLDPDVRWGPPGGSEWDCTSRRQVLEWWGTARKAGARAEVTEVVMGDDTALVGLKVFGTDEALRRGGPVERWQVLTLRDGLVTDIRGFDNRPTAASLAGVSG